jgi:dTMP kinase
LRGDSNRPGVFFCFEGIDGAGKTTQARILVERIEATGRKAVYVKEPTDGVWGREIRRIARDGRQGIDPSEELRYFIEDRKEDVRYNIAPTLAAGGVVVADRYYYSTIAYQSVLGLDPDEIRERNRTFPVPDLVFLIDIPPGASQPRIVDSRGEQANLGYEQVDYLRRVKAVFDQMDDPNLVRIDGLAGPDEVADSIWRLAAPFLRPD